MLIDKMEKIVDCVAQFALISFFTLLGIALTSVAAILIWFVYQLITGEVL